MTSTKPETIDAYIAGFPEEVKAVLEQVRAAIKNSAPGCSEIISYAIPAFKLDGQFLIYMAAHKNHLGLYPVPSGNEALDKAFAGYKTSGKGTIQFPYKKPMPLELIDQIVQFRISDVNKRNQAKRK